MADVVTDSGSQQANEKVPKKGLGTKNMKWYIVGGLAAVAVLVFFFVSRSNTAASSDTSGTTADNALDPSTQSALENALAAQGAAYSSGSITGPQGPAGPTGATGATGSTGATGTQGKPGGGTTTVPKVVGLNSAAAGARLLAAGLIPGSEWQVTGTVNSQTPAAGSKVPVGSRVDVGVAKSATAKPASVTATSGPALTQHAATKTAVNSKLAAL